MADRMWTDQMNLIKLNSSSKRNKFYLFSHSVPLHLILKYMHAYILENLIHHIVHMEYFNDTLSILQNFEKTIWAQGTWMKFNQVFWQVFFRIVSGSTFWSFQRKPL